MRSNGREIIHAGYGRYYQTLYPSANMVLLAPADVASPTLSTSYSDQASLGYSWQLNPWLGLSADVVHIDYRDIPFRFRANPIDPTTGQRRFPQFGNFRIWYGKGRAKYNGFNLRPHVRLGRLLELQGFYTYSRASGNVLVGADDFRLTASDWQPDLTGAGVSDVSVNPLDPLCAACFGPLATDSRHRVALSAILYAPFGLKFSGFFRYHSAMPFMDWTGVDINGDGFRLDLPADVAHVNALRGHSFSQLDARVSKEFTFGERLGVEVLIEAFNLTNAKNPTAYRGARSNPLTYRTPSRYAGDPGQGEQRAAQVGVRVTF
jgi:hypothetical protein